MFRTISEQIHYILMESSSGPFKAGDIVYFDGETDERYIVCSVYTHVGVKSGDKTLYDIDVSPMSYPPPGGYNFRFIYGKSLDRLGFLNKSKDQSIVFDTRELADDYLAKVRKNIATVGHPSYYGRDDIEAGHVTLDFSKRRPEWAKER